MVDTRASVDRPGRAMLQAVRDRLALRRDPVLVAAALLIVAGIAWRAYIAAGGYLAHDDYRSAQWALESGLTPGYVFKVWNDHLTPAAQVIYWALTKLTGLAYWPYLVLLLLVQAAGAVVFLRLLRQVLAPGWALLIPLAMFQFTPITFESTSHISTGIRLVPMQLAMVWALSAQVSYIRTRERRHVVSGALALLFGLLFMETSVLIAPLLVVFTACLYASGPPLRRLWEALRRYWPMWVTLAALSAFWLAVYLVRARANGPTIGTPGPRSAGEVITFLHQYFELMLVPGLLGGPVSWAFFGDGPGAVNPAPALALVSLVVMLALAVLTVARRPRAAWAWGMVAVYAVPEAALLAAKRLGSGLSALTGLAPRYGADVAVVAALGIGVAIAGQRGMNQTRPSPAWARSRPVLVLGAVTLAAAAVASLVSGLRYAEGWSHKFGRDYLHNAQADLAAMPPGTVFFDRLVPIDMVFTFDAKERRQSSILAAAKGPQPAFVTEGESVFVIADDGHVRPAWVAGPAAVPGPSECGWPISGGVPVTIPLDGPATYSWAVRIVYESSADTTATWRLGGASQDFPVRRGQHQYFFLTGTGWNPYSWASGDSVELSLRDPAASFCTSEVAVGEPTGAP